jgi:hypothetical protein
MVRERWSIEGWNCIRDTQLHEDAHLLSRRRRWGDGYAADSSPQPPPIGGISINPGGGAGMQALMNDITALLALAMRQPNPEPI